MRAYAEDYLSDVVETQGKLFDFVAQKFPDKDTEEFIKTYMKSNTRKSIDEAQALCKYYGLQRIVGIFSKNGTIFAKEW